MRCPICDQKPMNCDCTETERRQYGEIEDLRLTYEEREAIELAAHVIGMGYADTAATLRALLERTE